MESEKVKFSVSRVLFILLLFVVLPAGSWYYLRGGLNWRKTAVAELKTFGKIREAWVINPDGTRMDLLKNKVCVVHYFGDDPDLTEANKKILETGQELIKQFGQNNYFRNVVVWQGGTPEFKEYWKNVPENNGPIWVYDGALGSWKTIMVNQYEYFTLQEKAKPAQEYFALADTTGTIRRFYNALDPQEVNRMVEHIAILLPKVEN